VLLHSGAACDVLVIGTSTDPHIDQVLTHLGQGISVFRLDIDRFPRDISLTWASSPNSTFTATRNGATVDLTTARIIWFRRLGAIGITPAMAADGHRPFAVAESEVLLEAIVHILPKALWINHYDYVRLARNKIHQLLVAEECGLTTPKSLVTNRPSDAADFIGDMSAAIYKTLSSPRISYRDHTSLVFTHALSPKDMQNVDRVSVAPCFFQENIAKAYELRITVVGATQFAVKIFSQELPTARTDWRAASFGALRYESTALPADVSDRLALLLRRLRLDFAAVDMIVTPDGEHVFLEANPHGAWLWLETRVRVPVSACFAQFISALVDKQRLSAPTDAL
jgi:hypothetical protein